jgi:hypothetical protein
VRTKPNVPEALAKQLSPLMLRRDLEFAEYHGNDMGEWYLSMENDRFSMLITRERGGREHLQIGSKIRAKKGAPLRSWTLGHLRGYLEALDTHYSFGSLDEQLTWLDSHEQELFDDSLLNAEELRKWSSKVAKKFLG